MGFHCKIILSSYTREDKEKRVYLQAIIDRKRAIVPLGFYLQPDGFDPRRQRMKPWHPNAKNYDTEFQIAIAKANNIASQYRIEGKSLTPKQFREEFTNPADHADLIKFIKKELELKKPKIAFNTYKQHNTVINKLTAFRKAIPFGTINIDLMTQFHNELLKTLQPPSVNKILKIVKQWLVEARLKGHVFKDPFVAIKIKHFRSNRLALSEAELQRFENYYDKTSCPRHHKKLLRYFLFSCYTGIRISDIKVISWSQLHDDVLIFTPQKTRFKSETITVPVTKKARRFLPQFSSKSRKIFDTFADQVSNRYLKKIAEALEIKKKITYHTSRHTFGSIFANPGGNERGDVVALQRIMGHGDIKTTMGYVHASTKALVDAAKKRFDGPEIPETKPA